MSITNYIDSFLIHHLFVRLSSYLYNSSLNDNKIRCITSGAFDKLRSLLQVNLQNNPFNCNCHLRWMSSWLRKKSSNNKILIGKFIALQCFQLIEFPSIVNARQYTMLFTGQRCQYTDWRCWTGWFSMWWRWRRSWMRSWWSMPFTLHMFRNSCSMFATKIKTCTEIYTNYNNWTLSWYEWNFCYSYRSKSFGRT